MSERALPLLQNIRAQPETLRRVLDHHRGPGASRLQQAARALRAAPRVVLAAIGASYCAAIPLATRLAGAGVDASLVDAAELLHYRHPAFAADTLFVLISRSGASVEIERLLPLLRRRGAPLLGITDVPESPLGRAAGSLLLLASRPDQMVAVQSYSATLLTLYLLGRAALDRPQSETIRAAETAIRTMARTLPTWEEAGDGWQPFLDAPGPLYLLARGGGLASARAGALLFHEVAKQPAVAMSAGAFRHGAVEVVDRHFRALLFVPPAPTRPLTLALAREIADLGGRVRLVGPRPAAAATPAAWWWDTDTAPPGLAPLLEIVPLQLAAVNLARWRGIVPGSFRVLPQVIRSETTLRG